MDLFALNAEKLNYNKMRELIIIIATIALMLFTSCEEKEPIRKGDVMAWIDTENPFHPICDTVKILDIKGDYCLLERRYKGSIWTSSDRTKLIGKLYTKIK